MNELIEFNNTTLFYGFFNEFVFPEAKMNIQHLKDFYKSELSLKGNTLVEKLIQLIEKYNFSDITEAAFISVLQDDGKSNAEIETIISKVKEFKYYTKEQAKIIRDHLERLCCKAYVNKINRSLENDVVKYIKAIQKFEYKSNHSDTLTVKKFSELDITDLISRYSSEGFKSRYEFINESFTCGGYIPGQIVTVVAAPGVGKSLFLMGEAVNFIEQGKRVHYLALGDLNEIDIVTRMTCMIAQKPRYEVESNIESFHELYQHKFENLGITVVPSGYVSAFDYTDWMKNGVADEYDVLLVDYDSNFKSDGNLSMYSQYGDTYDLLTQLTRLGKLVFVACQPIKSVYNEVILHKDTLGESSRKIHISDMIITIGKNPESWMPIGYFHIAKNRRGYEGGTQPWIRTNEGLFYPCSEDHYSTYRCDKRKGRYFSYKELEGYDFLNEVKINFDKNKK